MAGTPDECIEQIKTNVQAAGINHMVLAVTDSDLVEFFTEQKVENVPDVRGQLKLIAERIMPAFA